MNTTTIGPDGHLRCQWCAAAPEFLPYHDTEWGFPVDDDRRLFEKLCLEGFQSGLSWRTILNKRESFRVAFRNFDIEKVARFSETDIKCLLKNDGIVRHRGKIAAAINDARRARELIRQEGSLAAHIWRFEPKADELAPPYTATTKSAADVSSSEYRSARLAFEAKIRRYAPRCVAFLGKRALSTMIGQSHLDWGEHMSTFVGTMAWVLPNPSGLNRSFTLDALVVAYSELRAALDRRPVAQ